MSAGVFLKTLNNLSPGSAAVGQGSEAVRKLVLDRLQGAPASLSELGELPVPLSTIEQELGALRQLGLVEMSNDRGGVYRLTDYAQKALRSLAVSS